MQHMCTSVYRLPPIISPCFPPGALLCGTAYLASTRKALVEEGIDLQARTRAVPLAARALLLSTTGCVALGGLSWVAFQWAGGATSAATVQLGTARQAALLLAQQREAVAAEFRKALKGASEDSTAAVQKGHD